MNKVAPQADSSKVAADVEKKLIQCTKISKRDLNSEENLAMRSFYWAAFYGMTKYLRILIEDYLWSPFIKSYDDRSIISGAILGKQLEALRFMLENYEYEDVNPTSLAEFLRSFYGKDSHDNNAMHYAYMIDMPEVREILRSTKFDPLELQRLNRRGKLPSQLRHYTKAEDSISEDEDEDAGSAAHNSSFVVSGKKAEIHKLN